ncbi:MAG: hypothetical protein ACQEW5_24875 [Bacillota bacterium]
MFKKSFVLSFLAAVLIFNSAIPGIASIQAFAAEKEQSSKITQVESNEKKNKKEEDGEVEDAGKLGYLVKGALYTIKYAIKAGNYVLDYLEKWLDSSTIRYMSSNGSKISTGIDKAIAKINEATDYTTSTIRSIVYSGMTSAGVPGTYALPIADAIATTVDWLLL